MMLTSIGFSIWAKDVNLPVNEILGREYYIYEVKKGDSAYGIAKKYGWDLEELLRLNPEAQGDLKKGTRLYYPTGQLMVVTEMTQPVEIDFSQLEPIRHKVKKGETVYSISRQYNIPVETIYRHHPSAQKGIKAGEIIELPQNGNAPFYYYTLKKDDTLPSLSQDYNTSVEDILMNNPGLTTDSLVPGETIRIKLNSNAGKIKTELVAEERVSSITGYKVSKNETWDDISEKTGVEVTVLKEANNTTENPERNSIVNIPVMETVEVEKTVEVTPPQSVTTEEIQEIYDNIKGVNYEEPTDEVRIALVLDDPKGKKDVEFTRGALMALDEFKDTPYKINLKVIDGRVSSTDLESQLDEFEPGIIVVTADKAFPLFLADYGNTHSIQIVNVFDVRNDLYEDNASMVQLLPPSAYYNDRIATQLYKKNSIRKLIMVGDEDPNDGIAIELMKLFDDADKISMEEFGMFEPDLTETVLIYSYATKKDEISDFFKNVEELENNNPGYNFKVVGRSNWVSMIDTFEDRFGKYRVNIPTRVWVDENSNDWELFTDAYDEMFGGVPVRSIPNFAASGYDVIKYFVPVVNDNGGDFNHGLSNSGSQGLQIEIDLKRVNNWGGFINGNCYIMAFGPDKSIEKINVN